MPVVIVSGSFDDLRSRHVRFLEEASKLGDLHVLLWTDEVVRELTGKSPKFPLAERRYLVEAIRYVNQVTRATNPGLPEDLTGFSRNLSGLPLTWAVDEADDTPAKRAYCAAHGLACRVFTATDLQGFPEGRDQESGSRGQESIALPSQASISDLHAKRPTVLVTGCYDWLHSGHVRFFEEASTYGDLYVVAGQDANLRHLKGEGHPMQTQEERRYMIGAIRYVKQALIATGWGWLDAEPEIQRLRPDIYLVNEDGDVPEKREYCAAHGLQYVVLKRTPKAGLPRRSSSDLRGF